MELKELLHVRRSIRKFEDRPVEREVVEQLLKEAFTAPSSRNTRSTRYMVVEGREMMERISQMRDYGSAFMKHATAAIVVTSDKTLTDLWVDNCAIAATTIQLAIVDEGLASCWVHVNDRPCLKDEPDGAKADDFLRSLLGIPEHYGILCAVALGYSDYEPKPLPPYEGEERVHWL